MSKLRQLAKSIYEKTKAMPWRTTAASSCGWFPEVGSPELEVGGRKYELRIRAFNDKLSNLWRLKIEVRVDDSVFYPGGVYHRRWPWAWEREVFSRVISSSYETRIIPDEAVRDDILATLQPPPPGGDAGGLCLSPQEGQTDE